VNRIDVVRAALSSTGARSYLEIGVKDGDCFHAVEAPTRVAVDPHFAFRPPLATRLRRVLGARTGTFYFQTTSDDFYRRAVHRFAPFDVVFVDGLHTYEQSYRDVENALRVLAARGVILVHDCSPSSAAAAAPTLDEAARTPGWAWEWNGDVYRTIVRLRTRPDLRVSVLDCDHGVAIVARGRPDQRLGLTPEAIAALDYDALSSDRETLLGLRRAEDLKDVLGALRG
jgi:Methyltransferase domain